MPLTTFSLNLAEAMYFKMRSLINKVPYFGWRIRSAPGLKHINAIANFVDREEHKVEHQRNAKDDHILGARLHYVKDDGRDERVDLSG